ncbi:hypothetical protein M501DRAFT_1016692 [Patellaria atrata CBS 101060]|uniref:Sister chromatid cohesion acetyltransferase Eco1 n=1 Tax=Patellaria atrata CBS 101060 TaxID=1346257 RepID=A0A9P4S9T7_9PEZI|nr:hypothetical protein M501DRAFT_1016692 [Patellaria atrata CBS 101060]
MRTRPTLKTYTRHRISINDDEPPTKRQRLSYPHDENKKDAISNSKPRELSRNAISRHTPSSPHAESSICSDPVCPNSTPPSSPPTKVALPAIPQKKRPAFSFSQWKKDATMVAREPLTEMITNMQSATIPLKKKRKKTLTQMRIDLGGEIRKTCKVCSMEYIPSTAEDAALHKKFHAMNVGGIDLTKPFVDQIRTSKIWSGDDGAFVIAVSRKDTQASRNKVRKILEVVNKELGAVDIEDDKLWSQISAMADCNKTKRNVQRDRGTNSDLKIPCPRYDRFKAYLYIQGGKCTGLCLAERISKARRVLESKENTAVEYGSTDTISSSISASNGAVTSMLGISRIWTSSSHRRKGIANILLDCAAANFLYGMRIPKDMIAFSQPTESGGKLAQKWFGKKSGWHVYVD